MSQFNPAIVWTEREGDIPGTIMNEGDWEACVATSVSEALLYGGVTMVAPYTQKQRELIEYYGAPADRDQNLALSDTMTLKVYGVKLRGPSVTTSKEAFLARPGMGFCLTGVGSPVGAQAGTFTHEVFAVCINPTTIRVYDPLLPAGSAPRDRSVAQMAAWMVGIASHQVREVRKDEFMANIIIVEAVKFLGADGKPAARNVSFAAGQRVQGWALDGTFEYFTAGPGGSAAPADARCTIVRDDGRAPKGSGFVRITAGVFADHPYVAEAQIGVKVGADPAPPALDCAGAVADATAPLKVRITELEQAINSHVEQVTKPEDDLLAALD